MARRQVQQVGGLVPRVEWRVRPDSEAGVLTQASRSRLEGNARLIGNGGSATYSFRILGGMDIALRLTISGEGQVRVRTQAGGLLARAFRGGVQQLNLTTRAPLNPPVQTLQVIVEARRRTQARVYELQLVASDRDEDRDGIGDGVERLLGAPANALRPTLPATPRSGYQTGADYSPRLDLATDAVILHSFDPARLANWKTRGYPIIVMGGFRDYLPYAEANPDAVQRTRDGAPMSIESSFYLAPTPERIEVLIRQYLQMLEAGADAVCPEEPEYWADAGYEGAFRQLYEARLGRPWQPPDESHAARWTADRFKAQLMTEAVHAILNAARARKPNAKRMVAVHSPLNYALWRICLAHYALIFEDGFPDLPPP
jgi:RimJ/RimL family protein N-acetyltransferase